MANKHISEDEIKYIVDVESSKAQKEIYQLEQQSKKLRSENKARLAQLIQLEAAGKKETDTYKNLKKQYSETGKELRSLTTRIGEQTSKLNVLDMTMVQLKKQQKSLQRELDNTSKSLNPEAYDTLEGKLRDINARIASLKQDAKGLKEVLASDDFLGVLSGNLATKVAETIGGWGKSLANFATESVKEGLRIAETADGVTKAFKDLDDAHLLDNLRKATKGTVNDVQLMTAAVQAKDFRIPLEDLGKYLQFAQLKAQQTGQSVDYMTNSIVTGLGRKSPLILDNLGISAAEISEKTKETGDFMKAVAEIVDNQLAAAGETYISAADRAEQSVTRLQNAQLKSAIDQYNLSLEKSIKLRAYQDKLQELYKRQADQEDAKDRATQAKNKAQKSFNQANALNTYNHSQGKLGTTGMNALSSGMDIGTKQAAGALSNATNVLNEATMDLAVTNREIAKMESRIKKIDIPISVGGGGTSGGDGTGGGGHTGTTHDTPSKTDTKPNPDDIAAKSFSENRQADIDAANQDYQQDVNNWNMALAKKQTTQEKYDLAMTALKTQRTANILAIETSYAQQSQDINIKDAAKKKSLQDTQQKNLQAAEQKHFDQQVEAENAYQDALAKVMDQGGTQQELTLEEELAQKHDILKGYYNAALALAKQNGEDIDQLQKAYCEAEAQIQSEYAQKKADKMAEESEKEKQARQALGFDRQNEYDQQLEQLQQALDNQYISQEEYEKKVQELKKNSYEKQAQYFAELFSNTVTALQNAEMANVDAKYDAEIKAAEGNTAKQEKLEKKKANEKLKIQKKYADVNFAIQAAQIIANTATGVMKAFADLGPIAGAVAGSLVSVTGTAQLMVANAERQKVKRMTLSDTGSNASSGTRVASGRESGGSIDVEREQDGKRFRAKYEPGKRGYVDKPTVIVGEGPVGKSKEWVASNAALENPTVAPVIGILDQAQRAGNIRTFDLGKYLLAMQGRDMGGAIDGAGLGHVRTNSVSSPYQVRESANFATFAANSEVMSELTDLLRDLKENGIAASVALTEIEQKQQIRQQSRKFAQK